MASPDADSTRPGRRRPPARAASEPRNNAAALAWQIACARPTRCWLVCSADQSASPVAAAGAAAAIPAAISTREAGPVPRNRSSRTAEVQQPRGSRTSAGCTGWPNGTPCRASVRGPAGSARTTVPDSPRTTGSSARARSMRSARAAVRSGQGALRALPARRVVLGDGRTHNAYPRRRGAYRAVRSQTGRQGSPGGPAGRGLAVGGRDGGVDLGLARGEFGGVLPLDALGDVLVGAHQGLQVGPGGVEHAEIRVGAPDLVAPQADVLHARHDPAEQQRAERLLHRGVLGELQALGDVEAEPLPDLLGAEPVPHQVAALDDELLAVGPLGGGQLRVVVAQRQPPERDVPRLVLHDVR